MKLADLPTSQIAKRGCSNRTTEYFVQFEAGKAPEDDPTKLIPQLLEQVQVMGDLARRISRSLGGNGHCPELSGELVKELADHSK